MKKAICEGTFLPTGQRVLAIIQLCIVFSYVIWVGGHPFLGEVYDVKAGKLRYETVMDDERYEFLPLEERFLLEGKYMELQKRLEVSFADRFIRSMEILLVGLPVFTRAWVLLSVVIPICLLLRVEGSRRVVWLIPIVVFLGYLDRGSDGVGRNRDELLFPSESSLIERYGSGALTGGILEQRRQLEEAWGRYLVVEWANEEISLESHIFEEQKVKGGFNFNLERLQNLSEGGPNVGRNWLMYLIWNLSWAVIISVI